MRNIMSVLIYHIHLTQSPDEYKQNLLQVIKTLKDDLQRHGW